MSTSAASDESADLVRILGRTILVVNVLVGIFIFQFAGSDALGAAIAFIVSGPFAWGILRGIAQIRDRVEELVEEEG